jgi:hypothetical protein
VKFILPEDGLSQFKSIIVQCSFNKMAAILAALSVRGISERLWWVQELKHAKKNAGPVMFFRSDAKLSFRIDGELFIYCYASDGSDGLDAITELRIGEALVSVKRHSDKLNKSLACFRESSINMPGIEWRMSYNHSNIVKIL